MDTFIKIVCILFNIFVCGTFVYTIKNIVSLIKEYVEINKSFK